MKAKIDKEGKLIIIPENEIEQYAILQWLKEMHNGNMVVAADMGELK